MLRLRNLDRGTAGVGALVAISMLGLVLGFAPCLGCSKLSIGSSGSSGTAAAVTGEPAVPSPVVEITSPVRGSFLSPGQITITGRTSDPTMNQKIVGVTVNQQPVPLAEDGTFTTTMTLVSGLNTIAAVATTEEGRKGSSTIGVLAGQWGQALTPVPHAIAARATDPALDAIAEILEQALMAADLKGALTSANPIFTQDVLGFIHILIDIKDASFQNLRLGMDSTSGGLAIRPEITGLYIQVDIRVQAGSSSPFNLIRGVEILADQAIFGALLNLAPKPDGTVDITTSNPQTTLTNFRIQHPGVPSFILGLVKSAVEGLIRDKVNDAVVNDIPPLGEAKLAELLRPRSFDVLGKPFTLELRAEQISFDDRGMSGVMGTRMAGGNGLTAAAARAPGGFVTPSAPPSLLTAQGIALSIDDDCWNRVFHAAWAGGVMDLDIDQSFMQTVAGGGTGGGPSINLDMGVIQAFMPEAEGIAPEDAPIQIRLRPHLPPLVRLQNGPDMFQFQAGEVEIQFLVDRGQGWELVFSAMAQIDISAMVTLTTTGIDFSCTTLPRIQFEIMQEPMVEMDDRRVEMIFAVLLTPGVPYLFNSLKTITIPYMSNFSTFNVSAQRDGPAGDFFTIMCDMTR